MIRRTLAALLLIAAGLGVLHLTIGFENFAKVDSSPGDEPIRRTSDERGIGGGIKVGGGNEDIPTISVSGSGEFRDLRREERRLPDGSRLRLRVYELVAEDSETVAEDLVRLDRVTARFYRIEDEPAPPREVHVGTITARQAFLQVGEDEAGKPSVREDRDMDLRDVVLESTSEARVRGLRLEVARLLVRQTGQGIDFRTPTDDIPFAMAFAGGDEPTSLSGKGIRGILPPRMDAAGSVLEIHVTSDPELIRGRSSIRARGRLDYIEDVAAGLGDVVLFDDVVVDGLPGEVSGQTTNARGEQLVGRLVRFQPTEGSGRSSVDGGRQRATWRSLSLEGSPQRRAELVSGGLRLTCDRLSVRPAFDGEPAVFTADGDPELSDPTLPRAETPRFRAAERIHVVDLPRFLTGLHAPFGYPRPSFGRLAGRLVIFEGSSSIIEPSRGLEIEAADGLRLLRSFDDGASMVVGSGQVRVRGEDLTVEGPMGFVLRQIGEHRSVRLGPERADPAHAFVVGLATDDGDLGVRGSGACNFSRDADGATRFEVESPNEDLILERGTEALRGVRTLDAKIGADGSLQSFLAQGSRARIETTLQGRAGEEPEELVGEAREIRSPDGRSILLTGGASIDRAAGGHVEGDVVEVHRLGGNDAILLARGGPALVRAPVEGDGPAETIELEGRQLRLIPGVVPRALVALHGVDPRFATALTSRLAIADGSVQARALDSGGTTTSTARGDHLLLFTDSGVGTLRGWPAEVDSLTEDGRRLFARAPEIRVAGGELSVQRATLLPGDGLGPELEVFGREGERAFRAFRISCEVPIHADDVGVRIDGPFQVRGLDDNREIEPDGLKLDARELEMTWQPGTRAVERLVASGETVFRYRRMVAFGDEMRVDAIRTTLEVESLSDDPAGVEIRGQRLFGELFSANYETLAFRAWGLRGGGAR